MLSSSRFTVVETCERKRHVKDRFCRGTSYAKSALQMWLEFKAEQLKSAVDLLQTEIEW